MRRLLSDNGCPWDRAQSHASLRRYALEEACEVVDAIDRNDPNALREELGDLLFQVMFHAELGRKQGSFGLDDIIGGICDKLERRHPHVFSNAGPRDESEIKAAWDRIKAEEKPERTGLLDGIPTSLPALARAQRVGEKVEKVGFDWPDTAGSRAKVTEEVAELDDAVAAADQNDIEEEFGDVLFSLVNLARHLNVDAELALRRTTNKFMQRFAHVEARAKEQPGGLPTAQPDGTGTLPLAVLDAWWNEAKALEKARRATR